MATNTASQSGITRRRLRAAVEQAGGELSPQPGIADLGELVDHVRETGLAVQLWIEGEARTLSPAS